MPTRRFIADPKALYLTDNGRCLCGAHLGASAQLTGRDISGQRIEKLSAADIATEAAAGFALRCEEPRSVLNAALEAAHGEAQLEEELRQVVGPLMATITIELVRQHDQPHAWQAVARNLAMVCECVAVSLEADDLDAAGLVWHERQGSHVGDHHRMIADLRAAFGGQCKANGITP